MNIRLNRLDGKGRIRILGVTIFKYGASGTVPDLFQTSKLLNPVLLHSNFAPEADYRAPKARERGVETTESRSSSFQFCTGGRLPSAEGASTGGRQSIYASDCTRLAAKPLVSNKVYSYQKKR